MTRRATRLLVLTSSFVWAVSSLGLAAGPQAEADPPPQLQLKAASFDPLAGLPALPDDLRLAAEPSSGYFIAQFDRKIDPGVLATLRATGARTVSYLPDQAYVVKLPAGTASAVRGLASVRWLGAFQPGWKIAPDLGVRPFEDPARRAAGTLDVTVDLFPGEDGAAVALAVAAAGAELVDLQRFADTERLKVRATPGQIRAIAHLAAVAWIEEVGEITLRNTTARWVVQTDVTNSVTVWDHGILGAGQVIGHIDSRMDINSCFFRDPVNNTPGPAHRKVVAYRSSSGLGAVSHGTHTAGTSAGDQFPINGTTSGNGHAYLAKISHTNLSDITGSGASASNLYAMLQAAHQDGARVHTNSWGDDGTTAYTTWTRDIDDFSHDFEDSLVLFAVTNLGSLRTPENAKNVLAVGASQNGLNDDSFCSGGSGPTSDGRRKPEIYAPGCSIISARSGFTCSTTSSTGTSMACPAVTGAGALVREYFVDGWYPSGTPQPTDALTPSGALLKATLMNSAVDMTNIAGFPSNQEGWGRVLLENALYFEGDVRNLAVLADVRNAEGLTTAAQFTYPLQVDGAAEPLKITLAFTEPPAALFASAATINDLDLVVTSPTGTVYRGNVFSGGVSIPDGIADNKNNLEMVLVPSPETGAWSVRIEGTAVNQGQQGYAIVATGQVSVQQGTLLRYDGSLIDDAPPFGNGDGRIDPGETVTVPVEIRNLLGGDAEDVSAQLLNGVPDLVRITRETADYPDVDGNSVVTSLPPHYRMTIEPGVVCGAVLPFDLEIVHDGGELTTSSFELETGRTLLELPASGTPAVIPAVGAVTSTINVSDVRTIQNIEVRVDVSHANIGELKIILTSPEGTSVTLHNQSGTGVPNIHATYDSDIAPDGPGTMSDFDGETTQGNWRLLVKDAVSGAAAGTLDGWALLIQPTGGPVCHALTCPGDPVPGEVSSLVVGHSGGVPQLSWSAVAGADSYRVWRSNVPDFSHEHVAGTTTTTGFTDTTSGDIEFYLVGAVNGCNWEGPLQP